MQNRLKQVFPAQKSNDSTNTLSREDMSDMDTLTSDTVIHVPFVKSSRSPGASKYGTGIRLTSSGKWGVQIRHPFRRSRVWLGTYNTSEEAREVYNKKKIEYALLRSKSCEKDASFKVNKPKPCLDASLRVVGSHSSTCKPNCIVLALSAKDPKDSPRKKSGISSTQNRPGRLSMAQKCQNETAVLSKQGGAGDTPSPKKFRSLGAVKHHVLNITSSGKGVTKSEVWLGSCSINDEEEKNIDNKKKLEHACLMPTEVKHHEHTVLKVKGKGKRKRKKLVIRGITVRETTSGKWGVSFKDPISKIDIWLGSHLTPEEAAESYHKKKLELESTSAVHGPDIKEKDNVCITSHAVSSSSTAVMNPNGTDKWRVAVRHPMLKRSILLGSYDTSGEAEQVYSSTKTELDAILNSERIMFPKSVARYEGTDVKKYTGVRQSVTGRWMSQIQGPFSKKNKVHLGTFFTAEEAAEAFNRARHEFDAIVSIVKKRKLEDGSEPHKGKKSVFLEPDSMRVDERTSLLEIVVKSHPSSYPKSAVHVNNHSETVHVSAIEQEFGMDVVDSNGRLVGEYSRLDDDLWVSRPGDNDDFDINAALINSNTELAWDPDPNS